MLHRFQKVGLDECIQGITGTERIQWLKLISLLLYSLIKINITNGQNDEAFNP